MHSTGLLYYKIRYPLIRIIFTPLVSPHKISTLDLGTSKASARYLINSLFAFPFSGAAAMSILSVPSAIISLHCVRRAPGCTFTVIVIGFRLINCDKIRFTVQVYNNDTFKTIAL